jgi:hypothetical protein
MAPPTIGHQRVTIGMKIFDQITDVSPGSGRVEQVVDAKGSEPSRQHRQARQEGSAFNLGAN